MLNISTNSVSKLVDRKLYQSLRKVEGKYSSRKLIYAFTGIALIAVITMFLPWTQNIRSGGEVTTLKPDQRPQTIHSVIAGRVEKWYVKEGDFVHRGDTILFISEIKDEYFDPQLLDRTSDQLKAKERSVSAYMDKVQALDAQIDALNQTGQLKKEQAENKIKQAQLKVISDSTDYRASQVNFDIAERQLKRMESLYDQGLKSLTDLESMRLKVQKGQASMISAESKWLNSQNELINARVELTSIQAQYRDEIAKAESDKFTAMSDMYDAEAVVTKLQNQFMNYSVRTGLYYITAPQDGYVTQAIRSGIGETLKPGDPIVSIMPARYDLAVAMYVRPLHLPLISMGQHVRIQFDGWPAVVFSGWPNTSYGTYGGKVVAIDNFISDNGKYRLLVAPDPTDHPWPQALRVGSGTNNMVLLNDVPLWYELWRLVNGFPPDYYTSGSVSNKQIKK